MESRESNPEGKPNWEKRKSSVASAALAVIGLVVVLMVIGLATVWDFGVSTDMDAPQRTVTEERPSGIVPPRVEVEPTVGVSLGDILAVPAQYVGSAVVVQGRVGELITPSSFTLGSGTDEERILVLQWESARGGDPAVTDPEPGVESGAAGRGAAVGRGDRVEISGTVRRLGQSELEALVGTSVDQGRLAAWRNQPVLVATEVRRVAE